MIITHSTFLHWWECRMWGSYTEKDGRDKVWIQKQASRNIYMTFDLSSMKRCIKFHHHPACWQKQCLTERLTVRLTTNLPSFPSNPRTKRRATPQERAIPMISIMSPPRSQRLKTRVSLFQHHSLIYPHDTQVTQVLRWREGQTTDALIGQDLRFLSLLPWL